MEGHERGSERGQEHGRGQPHRGMGGARVWHGAGVWESARAWQGQEPGVGEGAGAWEGTARQGPGRGRGQERCRSLRVDMSVGGLVASRQGPGRGRSIARGKHQGTKGSSLGETGCRAVLSNDPVPPST